MDPAKMIVLTRPDGEVVGIRLGPDTAWWCPVCAESLSGQLPIDDKGRGSQDICPRCKTQFGADDDAYGADTVQGVWKRLRFAWLDRDGWSATAIQQLHERLGIQPDRLRVDADVFSRHRRA